MFQDLLTITADLTPDVVPDPPPQLVNFRALNDDIKRKTGPEFFNQSFIKEYLENKWVAEIHNINTFQNLYDQYLKAEGELKELLLTKLHEFKAVIKATLKPFRALWFDFRKYDLGDQDDKVNKVLATFGGSVTGWE